MSANEKASRKVIQNWSDYASMDVLFRRKTKNAEIGELGLVYLFWDSASSWDRSKLMLKIRTMQVGWNGVWQWMLMELDRGPREITQRRMGGTVSRRIWRVWICPKRMHCLRINTQGKPRRQLVNPGSPGNNSCWNGEMHEIRVSQIASSVISEHFWLTKSQHVCTITARMHACPL